MIRKRQIAAANKRRAMLAARRKRILAARKKKAEAEAVVGASLLLLDYCNILSESLLSIFEFGLQPFDIRFVDDLVVWLLEGDLSSEVLHFTQCFGLDP